MAKRLLNMITILLALLLTVLIVLVTLNFTRLSQEFSTSNSFDLNNPPVYRFMVILDGTDKSYVDEVSFGVSKAAKEYGVVYEMWHFEGEDKEANILKQFDIAIESEVDGIIIQPFEDQAFDEVLRKSNARNIPVITINEDIPGQEKVSNLSYNDYSIGNTIGNLLKDEFAKDDINQGTIVLFQDNLDVGQDMGSGIQEKISPRFTIKPIVDEFSGEESLNAVSETIKIIDLYKDLKAIVCSNGDETLGVIQALKEMNKLNEVLVIGNDDCDEILDYVERGTILATVVTNNERIGYEAISQMVEHNKGKFVSQYKDIVVELIDSSNIHSYYEKIGDRYE